MAIVRGRAESGGVDEGGIEAVDDPTDEREWEVEGLRRRIERLEEDRETVCEFI